MLEACRSLALFALAAALAAPVGAPRAQAPDGASPRINAPYRNPEYNRWKERFETEGREVYDRRMAIVAAAGATAGAVVADIGAGTGLFTRLFAHAVGASGRVYAMDVVPAFVEGTVRSAHAEGLRNVIGVLGDQSDTRLPADAVDLAFVTDAYHHFEHPAATLASIRRALRPGGRLLLVEFERIPGVSPAWILEHVRAGKETFRAEIEAAGFRFLEEVPLMKENYVLRFARD